MSASWDDPHDNVWEDELGADHVGGWFAAAWLVARFYALILGVFAVFWLIWFIV